MDYSYWMLQQLELWMFDIFGWLLVYLIAIFNVVI
jgi:hypothetical protein